MKTKNGKKIATLVPSLLVLCLFLTVTIVTCAQAQGPGGDDSGDPLLGGAFVAICLGVLVINIFIMIWVYKDAEARGESGALWLIIVLFAGIIGLIIWLVVRPPTVQPYMGQGGAPYGGYQPGYQQGPPTYGPPPDYNEPYYRKKERPPY